jgi:hypothetical protein
VAPAPTDGEIDEDQADQHLRERSGEKALHFYTDVAVFVKKADVTQGPYRWSTSIPPKYDQSEKTG